MSFIKTERVFLVFLSHVFYKRKENDIKLTIRLRSSPHYIFLVTLCMKTLEKSMVFLDLKINKK